MLLQLPRSATPKDGPSLDRSRASRGAGAGKLRLCFVAWRDRCSSLYLTQITDAPKVTTAIQGHYSDTDARGRRSCMATDTAQSWTKEATNGMVKMLRDAEGLQTLCWETPYVQPL